MSHYGEVQSTVKIRCNIVVKKFMHKKNILTLYYIKEFQNVIYIYILTQRCESREKQLGIKLPTLISSRAALGRHY